VSLAFIWQELPFLVLDSFFGWFWASLVPFCQSFLGFGIFVVGSPFLPRLASNRSPPDLLPK
jgi:hypothetical protein